MLPSCVWAIVKTNFLIKGCFPGGNSIVRWPSSIWRARRSISIGAIIKMTKAEGWETSAGPLTATFSVDMPGYASAAGKRFLVPAYLFQARQMDAFKHVDRKYPVYFPYAFGEVDRVNIKLPDG